MRAGKLDRTIAIQRKTETRSESGEPVETWADLSVRPASRIPVRGEERFAGPQWVAKEQVEFWVRWADVIADISPLDRVIYPVPDLTSSPPETITESMIYDIMAVPEIGRRVGIKIMAARRVDVAP